MTLFRSGEELSLPELARAQGLSSDTFTVVDVIRGGMGVCAKVRQGQGPAFAVKALPAGGKQGEAFERFLSEMQTWLKLSVCDGIVEALCVFPFRGTPVVCSRWMSGGNLRPHMEDKDPEYFYRTIVRIAGALDWAHREHGTLHHDLKPENILIDDLSRPAVSDWGISGTLAQEEAGTGATMMVYGTAAYASPEQLLGGVPLDVRSDIYALSCVMYEWEVGRVPFTGDFHEIRGAKIRTDPPKLTAGLFRRSNFGADDVISRGLQRERHGRYADWSSFVTDVVNAAQRRELRIGRFIPKMRYAAREVRGEVLRAKVAKGAVVTGRGGPAVDVRGAKKELDEALRLAGEGDWAAAVAILSRVVLPSVVRELPDDPLQQTSAITLARGLLKLDRPAEAVAVLDALSAATEKPSEMFELLANAHLKLGNPGLAERAASTGLLVHKTDPALLDLLLTAQSLQGQVSNAVATARRRLALQRDAGTLLDAAKHLLRHAASVPESRLPEALANIHEALAFASEARAAAPEDDRARVVRARALLALERWQDAKAELADFPDTAGVARRREAAELVARALLHLKVYAGCLAHCNTALAAFPRSTNLARTRARAFADGFILGVETGGRRAVDDAAMSFFEKMVADPAAREPGDFVTLARYREWTGRADDGIAVLREGRAALPKSWEIAVALAGFLERKGDFEDALEVAQDAVRLAPFRPEVWRALAAVKGIVGPKAEADEARQKAAQADKRIRELRAKSA
ncbi:MAG TPA: tetratricopeptide repeat protein [Thermoanaerobaculia bacterium]|nr:tetratricopeptide repeat protein [Thermoanaerobaculia bacterium]